MKIYIAGKITGDNNYRRKFETAENALIEQGNVVLSPTLIPEGMQPQDYMKICFAMIDCADIVYFMPDYAESNGAKLEHQYCQYVSKQTFYQQEVERNG